VKNWPRRRIRLLCCKERANKTTDDGLIEGFAITQRKKLRKTITSSLAINYQDYVPKFNNLKHSQLGGGLLHYGDMWNPRPARVLDVKELGELFVEFRKKQRIYYT